MSDGRVHQVRDDDRRGGARARRAARLLRRRRAARTSRSTSPSGRSRRTWSWSTRPACSGRGRRGCRCPSATRRSSPARPRSSRMFELFAFYLQGGLIDVGFLGAAQIDRFGNINTTVIGDVRRAEDAPARAPAGRARSRSTRAQVFVIMRQSKRGRSSSEIDFRTSPGNLGGAENAERIRREQGWHGRGPSVVVTDLGIWHFDETGEMRLDSLHPGATLDDVRATIAWEPRVSPDLAHDARADRRRAAPDPRGARPRGRLHEVAPMPQLTDVAAAHRRGAGPRVSSWNVLCSMSKSSARHAHRRSSAMAGSAPSASTSARHDVHARGDLQAWRSWQSTTPGRIEDVAPGRGPCRRPAGWPRAARRSPPQERIGPGQDHDPDDDRGDDVGAASSR